VTRSSVLLIGGTAMSVAVAWLPTVDSSWPLYPAFVVMGFLTHQMSDLLRFLQPGSASLAVSATTVAAIIGRTGTRNGREFGA
jgi:hypothetical protein